MNRSPKSSRQVNANGRNTPHYKRGPLEQLLSRYPNPSDYSRLLLELERKSEQIRPMIMRVLKLKTANLDNLKNGGFIRGAFSLDSKCTTEEFTLSNVLKLEFSSFFESREKLMKKGEDWAKPHEKEILNKVGHQTFVFFRSCQERIEEIDEEIERIEKDREMRRNIGEVVYYV